MKIKINRRRFILDCGILPLTNNGTRVNYKTKRRYHSKEYKDYIRELIFICIEQMLPDWRPLTGPLLLDGTIWLERPKSVKRDLPHTKPDIDNLLKPINDALEAANVYANDAQIVQYNLGKRYCTERESKIPGIHLIVSEIE